MTAPVPRGCNGRVLIDRTTTPPPRATDPRTRTWPGALPRRAVWVAGWLAAAAWALAFPLVSTLATHRAWGLSAAAGYAGAALAAWWLPRPRARALSLGCAVAGAVVVPLALFLLTGHGQSEVGVIERSGVLLVHRASPYLTDPRTVGEYTPYLPGMALFGLPRALFGDATLPLRVLGDARLWCAGVFLVCLRAGFACLAARPGTAHTPRAAYRTGLAALLASPVVALPLCVSGVDLPLAGLCCLGLALAARDRPVAAGLALAAACALKWTAWPAVAVAAALLGNVSGTRAALRCAGTAVAGAVAVALPSALLTPGPMVRQVLAFPTGRGDVPTPAASPLPGRLLADLGPLGWYAAVALLLCGGAAVAATLVLRPPATAVAAADRLAAGLCTAFLLAPAGRFGYLALPVLLVVWPRLAVGGRRGDARVRGAGRGHAPGVEAGGRRARRS
ncbi:glycosyltransferase 87 family protein [Streptomyces sp. AN091965]|uniref:glycosyltransferase 87 family protein n=1 Tax=Streptomyces sp. AN091965 TaxID=2927803 RepID=UPI001F61B33F|nr:glycosyltransferase 87 family protein [Streptomyces sp. AN091965]MCI3933581.1 glycosyltransferase 87 family protein [Streptomyces sp. AN091965]